VATAHPAAACAALVFALGRLATFPAVDVDVARAMRVNRMPMRPVVVDAVLARVLDLVLVFLVVAVALVSAAAGLALLALRLGPAARHPVAAAPSMLAFGLAAGFARGLAALLEFGIFVVGGLDLLAALGIIGLHRSFPAFSSPMAFVTPTMPHVGRVRRFLHLHSEVSVQGQASLAPLAGNNKIALWNLDAKSSVRHQIVRSSGQRRRATDTAVPNHAPMKEIALMADELIGGARPPRKRKSRAGSAQEAEYMRRGLARETHQVVNHGPPPVTN
jgi:hypothetical protein